MTLIIPAPGWFHRLKNQPNGHPFLISKSIPPGCLVPPTPETARYRFLIE